MQHQGRLLYNVVHRGLPIRRCLEDARQRRKQLKESQLVGGLVLVVLPQERRFVGFMLHGSKATDLTRQFAKVVPLWLCGVLVDNRSVVL